LLSGPATSRDPKRARELAKRNVEMEPNRPIFHWTLGVAELRCGDAMAALADFDAAVKLDPRLGAGVGNYYVAAARARSGDKAGAESAFKEAELWTSTRPQAKETLRAETVEAAAEARAALAAMK
jgi:predicted Zn-dependent protease